jgi:hypothetical protein
MNQLSNTAVPFQHQPRGKDSDSGVAVLDKEEETYRTAEVNEPVVSMQVKMLEPVREAAKYIATAQKMTAQQYVEKLIVTDLNKNKETIKEGRQQAEEFNGSTIAAKRFADRVELERLRKESITKGEQR